MQSVITRHAMGDESYPSYSRTTLPEQLAGIWKRRKWLMLLCFFVVFPAGVAFIMALPPLFRASTTIVVGQGDISTSVVAADRTEGLAERLDIINKALLSRSSLESLINRFNLYPELRAEQEAEYVIDRMRRDIGIRQEGASQQWDLNPTFTMTLSYQNWDPQLAATVTNELAALYGQENDRLVQRRNTRTTTFLGEQLEEVSNRLAAQELLISNYRNENLGTLPEQQGLSLTTLERLNSELALNGSKQLQLMNQRDTILANVNTAGLPGASTIGVSRVDALRGQLAEMRGQYTDRHPEIIRLKNEIAELERSPERANRPAVAATASRLPDINTLNKEMALLVEQQKVLEGRINGLQTRIESTPGVEQELLKLGNDYESVREEYMSVQKRYQEARMSESLGQQVQNAQMQVIEPAITPKFPIMPQTAQLIFLGFFLSLGFCAGMALVAEQFDTTFHSLQDVRSFTNLPVMGSIARIDTSGEKVQRGMRTLGKAFGVIAVIALLLIVARSLGSNGQEFVWLLAGRG
ncbi:MAG: GNVR domain-containing protein [Pseudomonadota bacterium]